MASTYALITLAQMAKALEAQGFEYVDSKHLNMTYCGEYIFQKYIDRAGKQYTIRVYTSVSKLTDDSREVGTDAIRVVVIANGKFTGEGRVNRTTNWEKNLASRILKWTDLFKICPQCSNPLKEKTGKHGVFYGCSTFPACGYTESKKG